MIQFDTVSNFLSEYGKTYIKGSNIAMRCPLCGDSKKSSIKKRFHVKCENGQAYFSCFNCGQSGTFSELVSKLKGISIAESIRLVETPDFENVVCSLSKPKPETIIPKITENLNYVLDHCISIDTDVSGHVKSKYKKLLLEFIEKRKIPPEYKIFIAYDGEYKNRIIIPIYEGNDIVYFQGCALDKDSYLKFKNPIVEKTGIIMNKTFFKRDKYIIVTEGIIDAMMIENNQGTCVLGGSVSDEFLSKLYTYTNKGIIIAVDNDERGDIERNKIISKSKYGSQVYFYVTPNNIKDLNELKIKQNTSNLYDYITSNIKDSWSYKIYKSI